MGIEMIYDVGMVFAMSSNVMRKEEYEMTRSKRDEIKRRLDQPMPFEYRETLEHELKDIRESLKNAHREQYNNQRGSSEQNN